MGQALQEELTALRRANERLIREFGTYRLSVLTAAIEKKRLSARCVTAVNAVGSGAQCRSSNRPERSVDNPFRAGPEPGDVFESSSQVDDLTEIAQRIEESVQLAAEAAEIIRVTVAEDLRQQQETLGSHLDRLGARIARLQRELATTRAAYITSQRDSNGGRRVTFQPISPNQAKVIVSDSAGKSRRAGQRPWYYTALILCVGVLAISLAAALYLAI